MKKLTRMFVVMIMPGLFGFLNACGTPQVKTEPIPMTANPTEEVSKLDSEIGSARANQINVLAPLSFAKAEEHLFWAKKGLEQGDEISAILDNVARGRAQLKRAHEVTQITKTALDDAIKAREDARSAGATVFEEEYPEAEKRFIELTEAIEKDNLDWARNNKTQVIDNFRELELRAIKDRTLGEVRMLIEQAEKEGAKKIAPEIFSDVQGELAAVDTFISENPYEKEAMLKKANAVLFNAQRLLQITRHSEQVKAMKPIEVTLSLEDSLYRMSQKLATLDMRNEPFKTQFDNIIAAISALQSDRQFMVDQVKDLKEEVESQKQAHLKGTEDLKSKYENEIDTLTKRIAVLEGQTRGEQAEMQRLQEEKRANELRLEAEKLMTERRLEAERRFNQLYNEVQTFFQPDEAEVYKQGSQLVIRLRAIQFPVGKAIIMPENYALLSKVQKAIRTFRDPEVLIEGHTDSTGSSALNETLSQQRAEAVREYLVANQTLPVEKISSIGYGSVRPLASNETAEGRAINRRIDVIVTPASEILQ